MNYENEIEAAKGRISYLEQQSEWLMRWAKTAPEARGLVVLHGTAQVSRRNNHDSVYDLTEGHCFYCDVKLNGEYARDHFIPKSAGGHNGKKNLVPACLDCNLDKGDRMPTSFESEKFEALRVKRIIDSGSKAVRKPQVRSGLGRGGRGAGC